MKGLKICWVKVREQGIVIVLYCLVELYLCRRMVYCEQREMDRTTLLTRWSSLLTLIMCFSRFLSFSVYISFVPLPSYLKFIRFGIISFQLFSSTTLYPSFICKILKEQFSTPGYYFWQDPPFFFWIDSVTISFNIFLCWDSRQQLSCVYMSLYAGDIGERFSKKWKKYS